MAYSCLSPLAFLRMPEASEKGLKRLTQGGFLPGLNYPLLFILTAFQNGIMMSW